eukprot:3650247-Rhodomonas_salina.2
MDVDLDGARVQHFGTRHPKIGEPHEGVDCMLDAHCSSQLACHGAELHLVQEEPGLVDANKGVNDLRVVDAREGHAREHPVHEDALHSAGRCGRREAVRAWVWRLAISDEPRQCA